MRYNDDGKVVFKVVLTAEVRTKLTKQDTKKMKDKFIFLFSIFFQLLTLYRNKLRHSKLSATIFVVVFLPNENIEKNIYI